MTGQYTRDLYYKSYDDLVDDWFLMSSPLKLIIIVAAYLLFVLKLGPAYMKDKPAYSLRNVLHVYNAVQVLYSGFIVYAGIKIISREGFLERKCILQNKEYKCMLHFYFMGKVMELLDTVFFVLRKKGNQISFLHVYHHTCMISISWIVLKYSPSYAFAFTITLNSFVHVVMYTYYGLSAFPGLAKHLWWKKHITKLQLIQFLMGITNITMNFVTSKCAPTYLLLIFNWVHTVLFIYLFGKFYLKSYKRKPVKCESNSRGERSVL